MIAIGTAEIESRKLVNELERKATLLERVLGRELNVTSGYRDSKKNASVNGDTNSYHMYGKAIDIRLDTFNGMNYDQIVDLLANVGFTGIGLYDWGAHADVRGLNALTWAKDRGYAFWDSRSKKTAITHDKAYGVDLVSNGSPVKPIYDDSKLIQIGMAVVGMLAVAGVVSGRD